jgi:hypothetical protein
MDPGDALRDKDGHDDRDLRALFAREPAHFPEQPFVNELARRVADERRTRAIVGRTLSGSVIGVAIATLVATAPWLISGSALLSAKLDRLFSAATGTLDSPFGYGAGLVFFVAATLVLRRRSSG